MDPDDAKAAAEQIGARLAQGEAARRVLGRIVLVLKHPGLRCLERTKAGRYALALQLSPLDVRPRIWESDTLERVIEPAADAIIERIEAEHQREQERQKLVVGSAS